MQKLLTQWEGEKHSISLVLTLAKLSTESQIQELHVTSGGHLVPLVSLSRATYSQLPRTEFRQMLNISKDAPWAVCSSVQPPSWCLCKQTGIMDMGLWGYGLDYSKVV